MLGGPGLLRGIAQLQAPVSPGRGGQEDNRDPQSMVSDRPPVTRAGEARGASRRGTGARTPSRPRGSSPPARRRCMTLRDGAAGMERRNDTIERGAACQETAQMAGSAGNTRQHRSGSARNAGSGASAASSQVVSTPPRGSRRGSAKGASNGSGGTPEREGRPQHRRPSAPRAVSPGVQQAIDRNEPIDDRSEGEVSGSDGGEDERLPAAVVPRVAAVGSGPGQPGELGLVWILGYSYVFWGAKRADVRPNGRQLRIPRQEALVRWIGVPDFFLV